MKETKMKIHGRSISILLLANFLLNRTGAEVQTAIRLMTPIVDTRYYVQCDVQLSDEYTAQLFYNHPVEMKDVNVECKVPNWRYCDTPPPPQVNGACGCSSKKRLKDGSYMYRFYLLIDPVTVAFTGSQFTCSVYTATDTRQMELVVFTTKPDTIIYACVNSTVRFNWEFKPVRDSIANRFNLTHISWTTGDNEMLGSYFKPEIGSPVLETSDTKKFVIATESSNLPQLVLLKINMGDSGEVITINVTFNISAIGSKQKRSHTIDTTTPADDTTISIADSNNTLDTVSTIKIPIDSTYSSRESITILPTSDSIPSVTDSKVDQTTTPLSLEFEMSEPERYLVQSVKLIVTVPPSPETQLSITAYESITGSLVVTCKVVMTYSGDPPVNVTIWLDDKLLITRQDIKILHYATVREGNTIFCGLEGKALGCLAQNDHRKQRVFFELRDLTKSSKPEEAVDLLLSLYAWESVICVILLLWAVSLLLDHALIVVRNTKKSLISKNKEDLEWHRKKRKQILKPVVVYSEEDESSMVSSIQN